MGLKAKNDNKNIKTIIDLTTWRNDLKETQSLTLYPVGNQNARGYEIWEIELKPGEEIEIPSEHDHIIQQLNKKKNLIVGGLAPRLTNLSRKKKIKLHSSLDVEAQDRKFNLEKVMKLSMQKKAMEEALALQAAEFEQNKVEEEVVSEDNKK